MQTEQTKLSLIRWMNWNNNLIPSYSFQANRQFIICINAVEHVYNYFNNKLKVAMRKNTDVEIIVSRDKAPCLKLDGLLMILHFYNKTVAR